MSKNILEASLEGAEHIVLLGHIHPDGDCIGTTLGLLNYLRENYPQIEAELFLDHPAAKFSYMNDFEKIHTEIVPEKQFDLCITLDASDKERLGGYAVYFDSAAKTLCIDHHRTNTGFAEQNYIIPDASSCSEVLYTLLDEAKISRAAAECLYTGIVHDTGVFKYNSTTRKTMEIAGTLMEKGVNAAKIIDDSFFAKTYGQAKLHGRAVLESVRILDNRCVYTVVTTDELREYGCTVKATDGIVDQLRIIEGIEIAFLLYQTGNPDEYKVSLRTNSAVDVSRIALSFGGGGHVKAAGCTMTGEPQEIVEKISGKIREQWEELK